MASRANVGGDAVLSSAAPQGNIRASIEQYFEISLFLLLVTGFFTLATTGRLDSPSVVLVALALLLRAFLFLQHRVLVIPERLTSLVTLGYVLFYAVDLFFISASFVTASVHLVLFSMVIKIYSVQRDRDHLYLAILAFLAVLSAAILTVDTIFLISFSIFMLLAVTTFTSMEMKRSAAAASGRPGQTPPGHRMERALSVTGLLLMLGILMAATLIFFILPRISAGYLSDYAPRSEFVSGFSDSVSLGEIGRIKQNDTVVMHINIEQDHGDHDLKWRGIALSQFDGKHWYNPSGAWMELRTSRNGNFNLVPDELRVHNAPGGWRPQYGNERPLYYRVVMEPVGTNTIFLASVPTTLMGRMREIGVDNTGSVWVDHGHLTESYDAISELQPRAELLRKFQGSTPPEIQRLDTQLPERLDQRVRQLAAQVTANARSEYDKAEAVEQYLKARYGYSLEMATTPPPDPISYFLFERKEGHCEYFASAMALMLRTLGIPARVVNGFRGGEYNDLTGSYIIRGRDAHTWVEVFLPGYAWVSFDPTPADPKAVAGNWSRFLLYLDAAKEFWREWVINYDFFHQRTLGANASSYMRFSVNRFRLWTRRQYFHLLGKAWDMHRRVTGSPGRWGGGAILVVMGILLLAATPWAVQQVRRLLLLRNPGRAPQSAASMWYGRMTRSVARHGYRKLPAQTPKEFVGTIDDSRLRASVWDFTVHYERARFGDSAEDAEKLPEMYEVIEGR